MDDLQQLEDWAAPLLAKLEPAQRRRLASTIARDLRRSQRQRIAEQRNPDGSPYAPRASASAAPRKNLRKRAGRIKRGAMFRKLRTAAHLKIRVDQNQASIGFFGRVSRIAQVHQEGRSDQVTRGGARVRYPQRELLGFSLTERDRIRELLIDHLTQ